MRGIGWDDFSRGTAAYEDEKRFYNRLKNVLRDKYEIEYSFEEDGEKVSEAILDGFYSFATIDLMNQNDELVGKELAINLRSNMRNAGDLDFPIFILSSSPEQFGIDDARIHNIVPVQKNLRDAATVAAQIAFHLKESGRYGRPKDVLLLARHARENLSGDPMDIDSLESVRDLIRSCDLKLVESMPEIFSLDILDDLRKKIQEAGKIIVLVTCDEFVKDGDICLARANIYLELGLVLGTKGGNSKLLIVQQSSAFLPSDVGAHQPIVFRENIDEEALSRIERALLSR